MARMWFLGGAWPGVCRGSAAAEGVTDTRGSSYAVAKNMSTKFPLTILLREPSDRLKLMELELNLVRRSRDLNQEGGQ